MAAILMLLPGLWIVMTGILMVVVDLGPVACLITFIAMLVGILYAMVKYKTFRKVIFIIAAILIVCGFTGTLSGLFKFIEGVLTFAFVLIYWFFIRD